MTAFKTPFLGRFVVARRGAPMIGDFLDDAFHAALQNTTIKRRRRRRSPPQYIVESDFFQLHRARAAHARRSSLVYHEAAPLRQQARQGHLLPCAHDDFRHFRHYTIRHARHDAMPASHNDARQATLLAFADAGDDKQPQGARSPIFMSYRRRRHS